MKKRGFTLVELLVMLVVLGILTAITIPNVVGILQNNREDAMFDDAYRLYELVLAKDAVTKIKPTSDSVCKKITMESLDLNQDFKSSPNGGTYNKEDSYVLIKRVTDAGVIKYKYCVRIVEEKDGEKYGIDLATIDKISKKDTNILNNITTTPNNSDCQCSSIE